MPEILTEHAIPIRPVDVTRATKLHARLGLLKGGIKPKIRKGGIQEHKHRRARLVQLTAPTLVRTSVISHRPITNGNR